jgi:hypothetical protein
LVLHLSLATLATKKHELLKIGTLSVGFKNSDHLSGKESIALSAAALQSTMREVCCQVGKIRSNIGIWNSSARYLPSKRQLPPNMAFLIGAQKSGELWC